MAYSALTMEELDRYKAMDATEEQISKANEKAKREFESKQTRQCLQVLSPMSTVKELRLLMLGKTGAGKSATSNLIIGGNDFEESAQTTSCTARIGFKSAMIDGIKVSVIDTPGFNDTNTTAEHVIHEMQKVVDYYEDGIHGIIFLFNMGNPRFTEEEQQTFKQIQQGNTLLGKGFMDNCFMVLSHGNNILKEKTVKEYIEAEVDGATLFGDLINHILGRRVMVVDNSESTPYGRQLQREQLVRMIANRNPKPFLPDLFKKFLDKQKKLAEEMPEKYRAQMEKVEQQLAESKRREAEAGNKNDVFGKMLPVLQMQLKEANENASRAVQQANEHAARMMQQANENAARAERRAEEMAAKVANQKPQIVRVNEPGCIIS